jgi:hypothetical protein
MPSNGGGHRRHPCQPPEAQGRIIEFAIADLIAKRLLLAMANGVCRIEDKAVPHRAEV